MVGLNPALFNLDVACAAVRPATSGNAELPGPVDTEIVTCVPLPTVLPAGGVSPITTPFGTEAFAVSAGTATRPARRIFALAAASLCPVTLGTVTVPVEDGRVSASTSTSATRAATTVAARAQRR